MWEEDFNLVVRGEGNQRACLILLHPSDYVVPLLNGESTNLPFANLYYAISEIGRLAQLV